MAIIKVDFTDNSDMALTELERKIAIALESIGMTAEEYAKENTPIDTGRLVNSISHAVEGHDCYVGTNVEYAVYIENGTSKIKPFHMLRDACENHSTEYKDMVETALKTY